MFEHLASASNAIGKVVGLVRGGASLEEVGHRR